MASQGNSSIGVTPDVAEYYRRLGDKCTPIQAQCLRAYDYQQRLRSLQAQHPPALPSVAATRATDVSARLRRRGVSGLGALEELARADTDSELGRLAGDQRAWLADVMEKWDLGMLSLSSFLLGEPRTHA